MLADAITRYSASTPDIFIATLSFVDVLLQYGSRPRLRWASISSLIREVVLGCVCRTVLRQLKVQRNGYYANSAYFEILVIGCWPYIWRPKLWQARSM
ncbi:hypothetical protein DAEQUDRAFT_334617 [Daedalea quercina L-15889]|uniref:Uncharacterized protein n=1 Tax=Daedalea quercina L-15889 TaxID=1314783 RepID=A0A165PNB3_9APHY|nr:hypothetical protein DAEQUDRAFT_334617 [Daedalea quercina L-15889]